MVSGYTRPCRLRDTGVDTRCRLLSTRLNTRVFICIDKNRHGYVQMQTLAGKRFKDK